MSTSIYVPKSWGHELIIANESYCGKRLCVRQGWACSYHYHQQKDETFWVESGSIYLETHFQDEVKEDFYQPGSSIRIPPLMWHSFAAMTRDVILFEFSTQHDDTDTFRADGRPSRLVPLDEWEALSERFVRNGMRQHYAHTMARG